MKNKPTAHTAAIVLACILTTMLTACSRTPEIRHIVLISIDTCRADYLSCYGYPQETTPHIDALAEHATRFEYVVSPAPITLPAHCSMLTGLIPPAHGVHDNTGYNLAPSSHTLAEILKADGFSTAGIISTFVLDRKRGLSQGFDVYHDTFDDTRRNRYGNERRGDQTTQLALQWLEQNQAEKSFIFLHYYDPHMDYLPPEPFSSEYADNPYAGEIAFTDDCIGDVIQKLKNLGLYDSSLIIITGDHGEMLGEHGEDEHTFFIYESAIRVPMLIKLPGQEEGAVVQQPVGLVDLVPTLCALLNMDLPSPVQGVDISACLQGELPEDYERFIYSESITPSRFGATSLMGISAGQWKYIQAPRQELYDVYADPAEADNQFAGEPHRARILQDRLRQALEQSVSPDPGSTQTQLDAESLKRLESLGYVAGKAQGDLTFDTSKADPKDIVHAYVSFLNAMTLAEAGKYAEAEKVLIEIIPQSSKYFQVHRLLGDVTMLQRKYDESVVYYRQALEVDPTQKKAMNNLAWLQATRPSIATRDMEEALEVAKELCRRTSYSDPKTLDTLAVAYAASGDFSKAVEIARKAKILASKTGNDKQVQRLDRLLRLFEQSKPLVEE